MLSLGYYVDVYSPLESAHESEARILLKVVCVMRRGRSHLLKFFVMNVYSRFFRHLSGGRERSSSACVSKRWLMLLSSFRNTEFCKNKNNDVSSSEDSASVDVEMISAEEDLEVECNGCLARSLEGKKATNIGLVGISVGTSTRGGLGKPSIRGSNTIRGVTDHGLSTIARGCHSLKALTLWNVPAVVDEGLLI